MKVAYIIPIYNVNKYLSECLKSLEKIKTNKEVILIDDKGSENPWPIIDNFLEKNSDFRCIVNEKNSGLGESRNNGIASISKDVTHIYFLDSDDFVDSEAIDECFRSQLKIGESLLAGEFYSYKKNETTKIKSKNDYLIFNSDKSQIHLPVYSCGSFWSVEAIGKNRFLTRTFEDTPWNIFVAKTNLEKNTTMKLPTYFYRKRLGSISNSKWKPSTLNDFSKLIEAIDKSNPINKDQLVKPRLATFYEAYYKLSKKMRAKVNEPEMSKKYVSKKLLKVIAIFQKISLFDIWFVKLHFKKDFYE